MERKKLELLAPAGDYDCAKAAILAGADAVYMGLKKFNARERASNLGLEELKEIVSIAHSHGTKIYVTMNTSRISARIQKRPRRLYQSHKQRDAA